MKQLYNKYILKRPLTVGQEKNAGEAEEREDESIRDLGVDHHEHVDGQVDHAARFVRAPLRTLMSFLSRQPQCERRPYVVADPEAAVPGG